MNHLFLFDLTNKITKTETEAVISEEGFKEVL